MTNSSSDHDLDPIESEVRAMLHRRAGDVDPQRPEWRSLGAPQVRVAYTRQRGLRAVPRRPTYVRPVTAVASVLVVVFLGVMAVDRMGGGGSSPDESAIASEGGDDGDVWPPRPSGDAHPEIPAPGSGAFDVFVATPVHPVIEEAELATLSAQALIKLGDPVDVATDYLASVGIEEGSGLVESLEVDIAEHADGSRPDPGLTDGVTVSWSTWADAAPAITSGHVYLRRSYETGQGATGELDDDDRPWVVVGARTHGLKVAGVHRDEDTLVFGVSRLEDVSGVEQLRIEVDGSPLERGLAPGDHDTFTVRAVDDEPVRIMVQHVDHEPLSVFEMTVPALDDGYYDLAELPDVVGADEQPETGVRSR